MTTKKLLFKNSRPLKYFIFSLTFIVFAVILTSCEQNPTAPNEPPKPPGYQEDIYWPSLADSPWPMNHHDPQSTGRSKFVGPASVKSISFLSSGELQNSIAIGLENNILFSPTRDSASLYSINFDGQILWTINIPSSEIFTTPLVAADGTVYFFTRQFNDWNLYSVEKNGNIKWSYKPGGGLMTLGLNIGIDGTIYFIDGLQNLVALDKWGKEKWKLNDNRFFSNMYSSLSFSPDGNDLYIQGLSDVTLIAVSIIEHKVIWTWGQRPLYNSPVVDSEGHIYVFPSYNQQSDEPKFYSINKDGTIRWEFQYNPSSYDYYLGLDPTIDKEGNVYFGSDTIYSLNYAGMLNWKYGINSDSLSDNNSSPLVCDAQSNIYLGTSEKKIICLDKEGQVRWITTQTQERALGYSPVINNLGTLFFPTFRSNNIIKIK
ncbi:MAG: PQQ-like beta-propeller repeat protein [Ignavibacteriales bacterium]|nr:PQQ-like beta-propeller repeat protein [Ignavibacteriales bacterium]